jgi:hypothetical protein
MRKTLLIFFSLVPLALSASCQKKGEGEVCEDDGECASGLLCDKHGKPTGKCLKPHHGPGEADGSAGADAASPDTKPAVDAPATVDTAPGGSPDAATSATPDSAAPDRAPDTTPPTPDATVPPDATAGMACEAYCTCMEQNCRMLSYPWANRAACLTACGQFSELQRTCFTNFCMSVPMVGQGEREHTCEHGAGELGTGECQ